MAGANLIIFPKRRKVRGHNEDWKNVLNDENKFGNRKRCRYLGSGLSGGNQKRLMYKGKKS